MNTSLSRGFSEKPQGDVLIRFSERIRAAGHLPLAADGIKVLQVNLGYRCNMHCAHCHASAGPTRTESMHPDTVGQVLTVLREAPIPTLDITGGAPELNPSFRFLVMQARKTGKEVIVRTNLTILYEPGMEDLPQFYRDQGAGLVASLPCYLEQNLDAARGRGVFEKSIDALRRLNELGFGAEGAGSLPLCLVYNPGGPFLPPPQAALEADYKRELKQGFGITFTRLYAFANMPIGRFQQALLRRGELGKYMTMLAAAFNPATIGRVMCRSILNVGWDGRLYDCDFNQVHGAVVSPEDHRHIRDFDYEPLARRQISVDDHCYGCTAGQGSS